MLDLYGRDRIERRRVSLDWRYAGEGAIDFAQIALYWQDSEQPPVHLRGPHSRPSTAPGSTPSTTASSAPAPRRARASRPARSSHAFVFGGDISDTRQEGAPRRHRAARRRDLPDPRLPGHRFHPGRAVHRRRDHASAAAASPSIRRCASIITASTRSTIRCSPTFAGAGQDGSRADAADRRGGRLGGGFSLYRQLRPGLQGAGADPGEPVLRQPRLRLHLDPQSGPAARRPARPSRRASAIKRGIVSAQLTGFTGSYDDFISQQQVSGSFTPADPAVFQFVNLDRVEVEGSRAGSASSIPAASTPTRPSPGRAAT